MASCEAHAETQAAKLLTHKDRRSRAAQGTVKAITQIMVTAEPLAVINAFLDQPISKGAPSYLGVYYYKGGLASFGATREKRGRDEARPGVRGDSFAVLHGRQVDDGLIPGEGGSDR